MVLAVAAIALLAAFTAAATTTSNLGVSSRLTNLMIAEDLAESAIQQALAELQGDFLWREDITLDNLAGLPQGARARLSFDRDADIPFSTNNYEGLEPDGYERQLAPQTIQLLATGECAGVVRHVEVVVSLPEFPITMACDGPVTVSNSLIASLPSFDDMSYSTSAGFAVDQDALEPGDLVSNSSSSSALVLDADTRVTGDLQALGGVALNGAVVEGEVRSPWSLPAPIPEFVITEFDPAANENTHYEELSAGVISNPVSLVGNVRVPGALTIRNSLALDNAVLYVDGNLTVEGPLSGTGAIVVKENATVKGGARLDANEQIALLTGGGATLTGDDMTQNLFAGLVYSRGPFSASNITVLGGFIVDEGAATTIADSAVYFSGVYVAPKIKSQVFAVVRRFQAPDPTVLDGDDELKSDDSLGFPTGTFTGIRVLPATGTTERTPGNVLDKLRNPDWARSDWKIDDPAVFSILWQNDQPLYLYAYWGNSDDGPVYAHWQNTDKAALIDYVATENSNGGYSAVAENLEGGPVPSKASLVAYYNRVLTHLETFKPNDGEPFNLKISPNEFLDPGDRLRIKLRRLF